MNRLPGTYRALFRAAGAMLSPGRQRASLLCLHYHRVAPQPDPVFPDNLDPAIFGAHLDVIRDVFDVLPLEEALDRLDAGSLPVRAACITFDDGYADNCEVALPLLRARGLVATFYVATGFTGRGNMWNDVVIEAMRRAGDRADLTSLGLGEHAMPDPQSRRRAIEAVVGQLKYLEPEQRLERAQAVAARLAGGEVPRLMMTEAQIRTLAAAGMEIGAHTVTHPILCQADVDAARREIVESRRTLEDITGRPVRTFAYPNGKPGLDYDRRHVEMVREAGFRAALTTSWGCITADSDRFQLPRVAPWDRTAPRFAARLVGSYLTTRPKVA